MNEIKLSELLAPSFHDIGASVLAQEHLEYWLSGGRGGTKSTFVAFMIIIGMMADPNANAVALRKYDNNLRKTVFKQFLWVIRKLGLSHLWRETVSPIEIKYLPTGQTISFSGATNVSNLKSSTEVEGYYKYIWFEELTEFDGMEDVRNVKQSLIRGDIDTAKENDYTIFYTYNPPQSANNWVNDEARKDVARRHKHHSTYLDVPANWLGKEFIFIAEELKRTNETAYNHEYLGIVTGTGGEVFKNVILREITNEEIENFDRVVNCLDWGYSIDPFAFIRFQNDKTRKTLYLFDEIYQLELSNSQIIDLIKERNIGRQYVYCDSAEPKSVAALRSGGINALGVKKGQGSVEYSMKLLINEYEQIIIDPKRCPQAANEFIKYERDPDGNGGWKAGYPDRNNHAIDACRYGLLGQRRRLHIKR